MAALISTQVLPLIGWATGRGIPRGLATAASLIGVVLISAGLAWVFSDALFGNLGGIGEDVRKGVALTAVVARGSRPAPAPQAATTGAVVAEAEAR